MDDTPYTTPEEDPFNVKPFLQPNSRHSTILHTSINRHHHRFPSSTALYPSPDPLPSFHFPEENAILRSYDFIQDDDIPCSASNVSPVTPTSTPRASNLQSKSPSFLNFNLPFRSNPTSQPSSPVTNNSFRPSSRLSFLPKSPRSGPSLSPTSDRTTPQQHVRSSSLSTLHASATCTSQRNSIATTPSRWRPSVLGHFSTPSTSSQASSPQTDMSYAPSRPSVSSGETATTTTGTTTENEFGVFFTKLSLVDTIRARGASTSSILKSKIASTSSVWSQTTHTSNTASSESPRSGSSQPSPSRWARTSSTHKFSPPAFDEDLDEDDEDHENGSLPIPPVPTSTRPQVAYSSGGTLSRVNFSSFTRRHKKRRLVVSGIRPNDIRRFDNLRRWCEDFGEVSQITRMPNNDLHVHFRRADVAETVCRIRAKVYINGVGSVQLSWTYGDKR
ncbi:hypothetical protein AMATHDRAFT_44649 [Amanita thiersii Skay4041]|uniref:RRM domain-containing protein n=1 Tax=Amanita thiersii Skay4041 TaxID=703135 RepID=A0A2A9P171_9AGAR|nr:hypothetical protein AMATHDRAFT_44649 [Amanita thiersii Skay4041]